ncbi:MAG: M28 family peptidase [Bacteroidales bacterium]|nr:M28 family peptidase [Bacteroidales bacterium]
MKKLSILLFTLISISLQAQIEDGRKFLNELCSDKMHGRGYVNNGIQNASNYIYNKFREFGLQSIFTDKECNPDSNKTVSRDCYIQRISYNVNTFPDKLNITIDGQKLIPGEDFIVHEISGGGEKTLKCIPFNKKDLQNICLGQKTTELKEKYKSKYAQYCLIFDETDTTFTKNEIETINNWITVDLVWSGVYNIGAIVKLTNQKLTQNISSICGNIPYIILSNKKFQSTTPKNIQFEITQKLEECNTSNIFGYLPASTKARKTIAFTAHYDHLGQYGPITYNGANDNASGMALLLSLAKFYHENPSFRENTDIYFIAFTGEELGLLGSKKFVQELVEPEDFDFVINLDLVGTGEEGICIVNGKIFDKELELIQKINNEKNYFSKIQIRGEACNSDHCSFYKKNIPCFYIYTKGGTQAYHDLNDNPNQLPLTKFNELFNLLVEFVKEYK